MTCTNDTRRNPRPIVLGAAVWLLAALSFAGCDRNDASPPAEVVKDAEPAKEFVPIRAIATDRAAEGSDRDRATEVPVESEASDSAHESANDDAAGPPTSGPWLQTVSSPAAMAVFENDLVALEAMLDAGLDPNEQDENWLSLLHHAARYGRHEAAKMLIERGADVNIRGRMNVTPLLWAARANHLDLCRLLVENGADVNARGAKDDMHTPLSFAVQANYVDIVDYLISVGGEM